MQDNLNNTGDHWITIAINIATLITTIACAFIQPLFSEWLRKRERRRLAANPDMNQLSDLKGKRLVFLSFLFPLLGILGSIVGLFFILRKKEPVTQATVFFISAYMIVICLNIFFPLAVFTLNKFNTWFDHMLSAAQHNKDTFDGLTQLENTMLETNNMVVEKLETITTQIKAVEKPKKKKKHEQ